MQRPWSFRFLWGLLSWCSLVASFQQPKRQSFQPVFTYSMCLQRQLLMTSNEQAEPGTDPESFYLRDVKYAELGQVADVILSSFYTNTTNPWKQMFRLAELNRIQQGFPHDDKEIHRNIVAVARIDGKEQIIGFCDLDNRLPNRNTGYTCNPRPYVSDLCISPQWRRKGVAKAIIQESEAYSREALKKAEIYIRVESHNLKALNLYESLGYRQIHNPDSPKKQILLLRKDMEMDVRAVTAKDVQMERTRPL